MFIIGRHINGITLNPLEWLSDDEGKNRQFATQAEAEQFLLDNGETQENLEWYTFEKVEEN